MPSEFARSLTTDTMAEILQRTVDPRVAPGGILRGHPNHQRRRCACSPGRPPRTRTYVHLRAIQFWDIRVSHAALAVPARSLAPRRARPALDGGPAPSFLTTIPTELTIQFSDTFMKRLCQVTRLVEAALGLCRQTSSERAQPSHPAKRDGRANGSHVVSLVVKRRSFTPPWRGGSPFYARSERHRTVPAHDKNPTEESRSLRDGSQERPPVPAR